MNRTSPYSPYVLRDTAPNFQCTSVLFLGKCFQKPSRAVWEQARHIFSCIPLGKGRTFKGKALGRAQSPSQSPKGLQGSWRGTGDKGQGHRERFHTARGIWGGNPSSWGWWDTGCSCPKRCKCSPPSLGVFKVKKGFEQTEVVEAGPGGWNGWDDF